MVITATPSAPTSMVVLPLVFLLLILFLSSKKQKFDLGDSTRRTQNLSKKQGESKWDMCDFFVEARGQ